MLAEFFLKRRVYFTKCTSFMLKNNIYQTIGAAAVFIVVIIIIPVTTGRGYRI